jgi:hypothetical protein
MDNIREAKSKVVHNGERTIAKAKSGVSEEGAIEYCERLYPEMMDEYKRIMQDQYKTFCKKQRNYGPGNISVGTDLSSSDDVQIIINGIMVQIER